MNDKNKNKKTCSICLNTLESNTNMTTRFSCGHAFHERCIRRWSRSKRQQQQNATCPMCRAPISNQMRAELKQRAENVLVAKRRLIFKIASTHRILTSGTSDTAIRYQFMTYESGVTTKNASSSSSTIIRPTNANHPDVRIDDFHAFMRTRFDPVFRYVMETSDPSEDTSEISSFVHALFGFLKTFVLFLKHLGEIKDPDRSVIVLFRYPRHGGDYDILKDPFLAYIRKHVLNAWKRKSVFEVTERLRAPEKVNEIRKWFNPSQLNM